MSEPRSSKSPSIAVFGCKATTWTLLRDIRLPAPVSHLVTIDPEQGARHEVADYLDLKPLVEPMGIQVYQAHSYSLKNAEDRSFLRSLRLDIAFVIGWQRLVPAEVLDALRLGAFGMHGSAMDLPRGRGRSPMNWALIEGRDVFYTNLFRYDPGVDSGDVADTIKFSIGPRDTAETLHFKNTLAMKHLIERNIGGLLRGDLALKPQEASVKPTYYPKRSPQDGLIDLGQDAHTLDRFIRAVTKPFSGAFLFYRGSRITILDAQVFDLNEFGFEALAIGTVAMLLGERKFLLKCIGGLLLVNVWEAGFEVQAGIVLDTNGQEPRTFPRNRSGGFDLEQH